MIAALRIILIEVLPLLLKWWVSTKDRDQKKEAARKKQKEVAEHADLILRREMDELSWKEYNRNLVLDALLRERRMRDPNPPK